MAPAAAAPLTVAGHGLTPTGIDLRANVRVEREAGIVAVGNVADLRALSFADASLAGVVCLYSLMYLPPPERPRAFSEQTRVVRQGGYLATAFKAGDDRVRRIGRSLNLGVEFDIYWLSPDQLHRQVTDAGFHVVFCGQVARPTPTSCRRRGYPHSPADLRQLLGHDVDEAAPTSPTPELAQRAAIADVA